ncbi:MAG: electron transfer flavoprotein subunit beta/FixA family protein [Clostridiales bacterium]|jgi:electron transfer flavoprotein beta subunit|nr:electron transfer flavoprotein subunit beta/FixA family protein [Clostridiales bacterium]
MKIIVCVKQVPDTTEVKLDPVKGTLIREGVPSIINPDDKSGIEAALSLKDQYGAHVTVLTMGPPQADAALREALAMGCDEAILLTDRMFGGADTWATASTIAGALKTMEFDLIITGRQAIDGDTAQVGPQIAERLNLPQVSYVEEFKCEDGKLFLKRQFEDRYQELEVKLPALITTLSELNKPRYMTVGGVFDAYGEDKVKTISYQDIKDHVDVANIGLKGSPTRVFKSFTKSPKALGQFHDGVTTDQAVELIVSKLKEKFII